MALSKNRIKYTRSLELKKNRKIDRVSLVRGSRLIDDLLGHFRYRFLIAIVEWLSVHRQLPMEDITEVSRRELSRADLLKTPRQMPAVLKQPDEIMDASVIAHSLCLALDDVQDPDSLGTMIQLADWSGIEHISCSPNTVDAYSPKIIQAAMGDIVRVKLYYTSSPGLIGSLKDISVYGTSLDGKNMYTQLLSIHGLIVMENGGNDIGNEVKQPISRKLYIPNYPLTRETPESLDVTIATTAVCAEFRRQAALL